MRVVLQRVAEASVHIGGLQKSCIHKGLLVFVGVEEEDGREDVHWLASKIVSLRIFNDENGKMNLSVKEIGGEILVISQFTLFAASKKGNRPSFIRAARPEKAIPLYEQFVEVLSEKLGKEVGTGSFGADMQVRLLNDGPVTLMLDTKNPE